MYLEKRICLLAYLSYYRLWGHRPIYMTVEGLYSPKATPNLDVIYRGLNYTTIYLPYLSRCPLVTSKTPCSASILETIVYKVAIYAPYPYLYHKLKMVNKEI